jgi:HD-like signal output (HDOD) protein
MNSLPSPTSPPLDASTAAFEFVKLLADELSGGRLELPSFPDVAIQVRRALGDDKSTIDQVVRIVGSEPALAARLLKMANSAALNRTGKAVTDLRTAINRMGYNMVRSSAISFAMAQIRRAGEVKNVERQLRELWEQSTFVAAMCYVIARKHSRVNADEALLAGLLHGLGKLYILTRIGRFPALFADPVALEQVQRDWHATIGKAILENWGFAEQMSEAVAHQDDIDRNHAGPADLTDVLTVGVMMAAYHGQPADLELNMQGVKAFGRLGLDSGNCVTVMRDFDQEIRELRDALGTA